MNRDPVTVVTDAQGERMLAATEDMLRRNAELLGLGFASTRALTDFRDGAEAERVWAIGEMGGEDARGAVAFYIILMDDLATALDALLVGANRRRPMPDPSDPTSPYAKLSAAWRSDFRGSRRSCLNKHRRPTAGRAHR